MRSVHRHLLFFESACIHFGRGPRFPWLPFHFLLSVHLHRFNKTCRTSAEQRTAFNHVAAITVSLPTHPPAARMYLHPLWLVAVAAAPVAALPYTFVLDPNFVPAHTETLEDVALFADPPSRTEPLINSPATTYYKDAGTQTLTTVLPTAATTTAAATDAATEQPTPTAPPPPHVAVPTPSVSPSPVRPAGQAEPEHWPLWLTGVTFFLIFYDLISVVVFVWMWMCGHLVWLCHENRSMHGEDGEGGEVRGYVVVRESERMVVGDRGREERQRWEREVRRMGLY
jgi:hypothetical protein